VCCFLFQTSQYSKFAILPDFDDAMSFPPALAPEQQPQQQQQSSIARKQLQALQQETCSAEVRLAGKPRGFCVHTLNDARQPVAVELHLVRYIIISCDSHRFYNAAVCKRWISADIKAHPAAIPCCFIGRNNYSKLLIMLHYLCWQPSCLELTNILKNTLSLRVMNHMFF